MGVYEVKGRKVIIPVSKEKFFLERYPDAKELPVFAYEVDGKKVVIPAINAPKFLKKYPNAKSLEFDLYQKENLLSDKDISQLTAQFAQKLESAHSPVERVNLYNEWNQQVQNILLQRYENFLQGKVSKVAPEIPKAAQFAAGIPAGFIKEATIGYVDIFKEAQKAPGTLPQTKKAIQQFAEQPAVKAGETVGGLAGMALPIVAVEAAVPAKKIAEKVIGKLTPKTAPFLYNAAKNIIEMPVVGAAFGAVRKKEEGETLPQAMVNDALAFTLFSIGLNAGIEGGKAFLKKILGIKSPAEMEQYFAELARKNRENEEAQILAKTIKEANEEAKQNLFKKFQQFAEEAQDKQIRDLWRDTSVRSSAEYEKMKQAYRKMEELLGQPQKELPPPKEGKPETPPPLVAPVRTEAKGELPWGPLVMGSGLDKEFENLSKEVMKLQSKKGSEAAQQKVIEWIANNPDKLDEAISWYSAKAKETFASDLPATKKLELGGRYGQMPDLLRQGSGKQMAPGKARNMLIEAVRKLPEEKRAKAIEAFNIKPEELKLEEKPVAKTAKKVAKKQVEPEKKVKESLINNKTVGIINNIKIKPEGTLIYTAEGYYYSPYKWHSPKEGIKAQPSKWVYLGSEGWAANRKVHEIRERLFNLIGKENTPKDLNEYIIIDDFIKQQKENKNLNISDFIEGLTEAIKKDIKDKSSGIVSAYRHTEKFLRENNLKLTDEQKRQIKLFATKIAKSKLLANEEKIKRLDEYFQEVISKPPAEPPPGMPKAATDGAVNQFVIYKEPKRAKIMRRLESFIYDIEKLEEQVADKFGKLNKKISDKVRTYYGRVKYHVDRIKDFRENLSKEIDDTAKKNNMDYDTVINDFRQYAMAVHAKEYNARFGDGQSGITNKQADEIIAIMQQKPYFDQIKKWQKDLVGIGKEALRIGHESGLINDEVYELLSNIYKNYVSFARVIDDEAVDFNAALMGGVNRGFYTEAKGLMRRRGSELPVDDVLDNTLYNAIKMIERAEKNRVAREAMEFAQEYPVFIEGNKPLFEFIKPRVIGNRTIKTESGKKVRIPIFEDVTHGIKGLPVIKVWVEGKPVYLKINDGNMALALKNLNIEHVPEFIRIVFAPLSKLTAMLATRFRPEFAPFNMFRDSQEMFQYLMSEKNFGIKSAFRTLADEAKSLKDVYDYLNGKNTEGAKLYELMLRSGGTTGGLSSVYKDKLKTEFSKFDKLYKAGKTRRALYHFVKYIDAYNRIFEDSTRLAVFRNALKNGYSVDEAAALAKKATIDFDVKGTWGSILNALWVFSQTSIHGSVKSLRAIFRDPKTGKIRPYPNKYGMAFLTSLGAAAYAANLWNDRIDPHWRNAISKWKRNNNLVLVYPIEGGKRIGYISLPLSWGIKPYKVLVDKLYDFTQGYVTPDEATNEVVASFWDAYNPLGGSDLLQAVTPTAVDVIADVYRNKGWYGGPIHPDFEFYKGLPEFRKYYPELEKSQVGKLAIKATKYLGEKNIIDVSPADVVYVLNQYAGGPARDFGRLMDTAEIVFKGKTGEGQLRRIFITHRVFGDVTKREWAQAVNKPIVTIMPEKMKELIRENAIEKLNRHQKALDYFYKFKYARSEAEKKQIAWELYNTDLRAYQLFYRYIRDDRLNYKDDERFVKYNMDIPNRAKYIKWRLENSDNPKETYKDLVKKKLITKKVLEEMMKQGINIKELLK